MTGSSALPLFPYREYLVRRMADKRWLLAMITDETQVKSQIYPDSTAGFTHAMQDGERWIREGHI